MGSTSFSAVLLYPVVWGSPLKEKKEKKISPQSLEQRKQNKQTNEKSKQTNTFTRGLVGMELCKGGVMRHDAQVHSPRDLGCG